MLRLRWRLVIAAVLAVILWTAALPLSDAWAAKSITLDEAIARALQVAPSIDSAIAQTDLSGGRVEEAWAPFYPWISANGEYTQAPGYDKTISNGGLTQAQLALTYTAFDGGRRQAQLRSARYAAQAAAFGIRAAQAQIVFDVTVGYFDLLRERETERELDTSVIRLSKYVNIVEALLRSGRAIANDVRTLRVTRDLAELAHAAAHQAAAQASIGLGSMVGDFDDATLQVAEVSGLPPPPPGDFAKNPAYEAAARQVEAGKLMVDAARAERSPAVNLTLTSGWQGINPPKTFGHHLGASYDG